jgi:hypothetical protein
LIFFEKSVDALFWLVCFGVGNLRLEEEDEWKFNSSSSTFRLEGEAFSN